MKKSIVVGATSGIGRELAEVLAGNDYLVGITGRRAELLSELKDEKPASFIPKTFDVTDLKTTIRKLEELTEELGGLDLLVISAGIGNVNKEFDFEIEKPIIETNVLGFTNVADWTFNYFKNQKSGHLVAISSVSGLRGNRWSPSYSATKAYQINYLEGLSQAAWNLENPIFITDIRPGFVDTDMAKEAARFWKASVEKATEQIFRAIKEKKKIAYITKRWRLIARIFKLIPRAIYDRG